jgi:asparagine synthetase B (glutamine-hydrolysing)
MISTRGPDYLTEKNISLNHNWHGCFAAAILWMQGPEISIQPSMDDNGNLLLWNGDLFSGCLVCI